MLAKEPMTVNVSNGVKKVLGNMSVYFFNDPVVIASCGVLILGIRNRSLNIGYNEITWRHNLIFLPKF